MFGLSTIQMILLGVAAYFVLTSVDLRGVFRKVKSIAAPRPRAESPLPGAPGETEATQLRLADLICCIDNDSEDEWKAFRLMVDVGDRWITEHEKPETS